MAAVNLFIFLSFMIVGTILSIGYKTLKKAKLSKALKVLQSKYNTQAERCKIIRNLSTDYFNSIGEASQEQISEMDKILKKIAKEIQNIHYQVNKASFRSLNSAQKSIKYLRGVEGSLSEKTSIFQYMNSPMYKKSSKKNSFKKPTWEFQINNLVELGAVQIMKASRNAKSLGLGTRNRQRKATTEILAGIAFIKL